MSSINAPGRRLAATTLGHASGSGYGGDEAPRGRIETHTTDNTMPNSPVADLSPSPNVSEDLARDFHTFLLIEGDLPEAARAYVAASAAEGEPDYDSACEEILRGDRAIETFFDTRARIDVEFDVSARAYVETMLAVQHLGMESNRSRLLEHLVRRDEVTRADVGGTNVLGERGHLDGPGRLQAREEAHAAEVLKDDLRRWARYVAAQRAAHEAMERSSDVQGQARFEALCDAMSERLDVLGPALERGAPLRSVFAADLALEESAPSPTREPGRGVSGRGRSRA